MKNGVLNHFLWENETTISFSATPINSYLTTILTMFKCSKLIEFTLVDSPAMQTINATTRGIDKPTDVLSFPFEPFKGAPLGNVVINLELAKEQAALLQHSLEDEVALLSIHGTLHLLGMDHENDQGEMRQKECELIEQFALPSSLIERTLHGA